ncbi:hypothetical protein ABLG96_18350 [Nakamurella sp. A5-74]|uniref:Uncharacterized protein n=1 Tax=Nakamurella sp. A5-74 TaxID=3158264 RepID=A0AAU8DLX5_9ACTN
MVQTLVEMVDAVGAEPGPGAARPPVQASSAAPEPRRREVRTLTSS